MGKLQTFLGFLTVLVVVAITYQVAGQLMGSLCCISIMGIILVALIMSLNGVKI
jgi:hypothetical protein